MKKVTAIANVTAGKLKLQNRFSFDNSVSELPDGKYNLTVTKAYNKASQKQFGYLYGVVYVHSILALIDAGYEDYKTVDEVDIFWKMQFANKEIVNRETGEIQKLPLTKSQFKTIDEMLYCDQIRNYCSEFLNYSIPECDPDYKNKKTEP